MTTTTSGSRVQGDPRPVTPAGILAEKLDEASRAIDASNAVDPHVQTLVREAAALAAGLEPYLTACTSPESAALAALDRRTRNEDWAARSTGSPAPLEQEMLSGHVEGQLLQFLVHATGARRVLDIGMFTGYSALAMAEALPADGTVVACEVDPHVADLARQSFSESSDGGKIRVRVGPAADTLAELAVEGQRFDLAFVDADKGGYLGYLDALLDDGLLAPRGVVCVDNTLMQGQPYVPGEPTANGTAIADFNRSVAADPRVQQVLIPLRDGITLIRRAQEHWSR